MSDTPLSGLMTSLRNRLGGPKGRDVEIRRVLEDRVSAESLAELLRRPDEVRIAGDRRPISCLVADLSGFARLMDRLEPAGAFRFLDELLGSLGRAVTTAGGTIGGADGETFTALFGAPVPQDDHAERACRAAWEMREELERLAQMARVAGELPSGIEIPAAVAVASGEAIVGAVTVAPFAGYLALGELASRVASLLGLNRHYGTQVLLSEATALAAGDAFLVRELDRVELTGQIEPWTLFELLAREPAPPLARQRVVRFEAGVAAYRRRELVRAERLFESVLEDVGEDGPSRVLAERCRQLRARPPAADWDGVTIFPGRSS